MRISYFSILTLNLGGLQFNKDNLNNFKLNSLDQEWNSETANLSSMSQYNLSIKEPKFCDKVKQYSGYLNTQDKNFFFWFFESRSKPSTDPLILWLNGGPGQSSLSGLLMGNGPCKLNSSRNSTVINPYSWNNNANIIYLDQPLDAGYSYGKGGGNNTISSMEQVYTFLQLFFQKFPKYKNLDFHAFGESYGGHYIPYLGKLINDNNKKPYANKINLKSIGIGNGLISPLIQSESYPVMACNNTYHPVLPQSSCDYMSDHLPNCTSLIAECNKNKNVETCINANNYCLQYISSPYVMAGLNVWDVRNKCETDTICYTILDDIQNYFNRKDIKQALGANTNINFTIFSDPVYDKFTNQGDFALDFGQYTADLLNNGIRALIYNGDADFICNWYGGKAWALDLDWIHKTNFNNAKDLTWKSPTSRKEFGQYRTYGDFTFLRVYKAGHFVPYFQPEAAFDMISRWINKNPF